MPMHGLPELPIAVLDVLPNPVLVKDSETRYVWVNDAFERLFGEELHRLATVDSLTGCLNRRALFEVAEKSMTETAAPVGLIALGLDHFKAVNDGYGHSGGDAVLVQFVEVASAQLRPARIVRPPRSTNSLPQPTSASTKRNASVGMGS